MPANEPTDHTLIPHKGAQEGALAAQAPSTREDRQAGELVVAPDGSIPAAQLRRLGVGPGARLRVVEVPAARSGGSFAGSLPHLADVSWEDFQRASQLAQRDLSPK